MKLKHLIFDFDGTIVDSTKLVSSHLSEYASIAKVTWSQLRDLPSHEVIKALGIKKIDIPKLILNIRSDFKSKISLQPIMPNIQEALYNLKKEGFIIHLVSSNSSQNIIDFLKIHMLSETVSSVNSFFTIFGKSYGIRKLLKSVQCPPENSIYIGDETRDIQAAIKAGTQSLSVTWGYNSEVALKKYKPDYLARTPKEMVSTILSLV